MAAVLEALFQGQCVPHHVVSWMLMEAQQLQIDLPEVLVNLQNEKKEFIPYFLNYLRGQTVHLLQSSKSASPSPAKCCEQAKPHTPVSTLRTSSYKRVQLFPDPLNYTSSSDNFTEEFPKLQADTPPTKSPNSSTQFYNKSYSSATAKNDENLCIRKRSKKTTNKKFFLEDTNDNRTFNEVCKDSPLAPSTKLSNKKRNWKVLQIDKKPPKDKLIYFLDNRNNLTPALPDQSLIQSQSNKVKPSRRIKPTPVQAGMERKQNQAFLQTPENKNESTDVLIKNQENIKRTYLSSNFDRERELLRIEKAKIIEATTNSWCASPTKPSFTSPFKNPSSDPAEAVEASMSLVTYHEELDCLVQLYSECLHAALFPNLAVEVFFLVQLLVVRCSGKDVTDTLTNNSHGHNYLRSIHNIVYFSVQVLQKLLPLLPLLGRTVLRLLCDNPRVGHFSLTLKKKLCQLQENNCTSSQLSPILLRSPIGGVSFQAETDNRSNFPTPKSFSTFRAQRDCFYELIREWKDNHEKPQWSMDCALGKKIRLTLSPDLELANYWHLAKLFVSQLITMYKEDNNITMDGEDDSISFLSQLKKSNPEKFKLLQERFIIPLSTNGPSPAPTFTGSQEFFHDYIVSANNHVFNQHLCDILMSKISELDKSELLSIQNSKEDGDAPNAVKKEFKSCMLTLRLLAKFLGFLTFLPYQSVNGLPEEVHSTYLNIRNKSLPAFDVMNHLREAFTKGRLCLTIPWVVEFLSWIDTLSPMLDYYQKIIHELLHIHRKTWINMKSKCCLETHLFIIVQIEWFLGIPNMPDGIFFTFSGKTEVIEVPEECLDKINLVDQSTLYICCPYLGSIKSLLLEFAMGSSSKASTLRKITPVAADDDDDDSTELSSKRQLQLQLEDNFFHNHPASLKRTAEFVAERTASNFIKQFRTCVLERLLQTGKKTVAELVEDNPACANAEELQSSAIDPLTKEFMEGVQNYLKLELKSYVQLHGMKVIDVILTDINEELKTVVLGIIVRLAEERIRQWMSANITKAMFTREMSRERTKLLKPNKIVMEKMTLPNIHDTVCRRPSEILVELKDVLRHILLEKSLPNIEKLKMSLCDAKKMLSKRQDTSLGIVKTLRDIISHLAIEIIINYPLEWSKLQETYLDLWHNHLHDETLDVVFGSDNLDRLMSKSPQKELSQFHFESLKVSILGIDFGRNCHT